MTEGMFQNPVLRADFADPGVLKVGDTYYAYATNAIGKNIQAAKSTDLVNWTMLQDALPALPTWAQLGGSLVWAPEVAQFGDQFIMYYTARDKASDRQCIGIAVSADPGGRFKDENDGPLICQADQGGSIDASPFSDGDTHYLYWKNDGNCCGKPTYIYVQQLAPDGLSLVGEPTQLVRNDAVWEGNLVEAPTMVKHEDRYYLFFSANDYAGPKYAVGYANCESATGPCEDAPENPILKSRMDQKPLVVGPGHQSVVQVGEQTWIVYHAWEVNSNGLRGDRRFMYIDRIDWQDGVPRVLGPTTDPQAMP
ncbi:MAG: family 43 glycosylhydrolase [Roseiflexaceae bacterium]|nr:family 43 glycosylhydrolase [Roseiflexaceae bacterium]